MFWGERQTRPVDLPTSKSSPFPIEDALKCVGAIKETDVVRDCRKIFDSGRSGEGWVYGYEIKLRNGKGLNIKEKNMISIASIPGEVANEHLNRFFQMQAVGIRIPRTYGVYRGALYQEFIVKDGTNDMYRQFATRDRLGHIEAAALKDLVDATRKIDQSGFRPLNILKDFIFDGDRRKFFLIDVGYDLGGSQSDAGRNGLNALIRRFPKHRALIEQEYGAR